MDVGKRLLLKGGVALAALAALPRTLLAAMWPEEAFAATEADAAMSALFGTNQATASDQITLKVPEIAENGAVVPVTISTTLADVESRQVKVTIGGCGG